MKQITIQNILTPKEIKRAQALYKEYAGTGLFAQKVRDELIIPNMGRINKNLGQENDPTYLSYVVEYVLSQGN
jgi:hypothetical protein